MNVRVAAVAVATFLFLAPVWAQEKPEPQEGPETAIARQVVSMLKEELDLSSEQEQKALTIIKDNMKQIMKKMMQRMGQEQNEEQNKKDQQEIRDKIQADIKEILDEGQKREFDVLIKEFDQRLGRFERRQNQPGGDALAWLEGHETATRERLLVKVENILLLSGDEKAVIIPKVDAILAARQAIKETKRQRRTDLSKAVHSGAKGDEVKERLHDLRERQKKLQEELDAAQETLRELLTVDQEARLVAIGVLD